MTLRRTVAALADSATVIVAYVAADMLRCALWQHTPWPEEHPEYGPTLWVHVRVMVVIAILWPLVLSWLGWYRPGTWPRRWLLGQLVMACVLLVLSMAAYSILFERGIYPRAQIGFLLLLLPAVTVIMRILIRSGSRARSSHPTAQRG